MSMPVQGPEPDDRGPEAFERAETTQGLSGPRTVETGGREAPPSERQQGEEHEPGTVQEPAKVMRIAIMSRQLLDELRETPLDRASRGRLRDIYDQSLRELSGTLSPELTQELEEMAHPIDDAAPTDAELRIAQAQLVGWLEGLFRGIQTAVFAQQMAAQAELDRMRRQHLLAPGRRAGEQTEMPSTGNYL